VSFRQPHEVEHRAATRKRRWGRIKGHESLAGRRIIGGVRIKAQGPLVCPLVSGLLTSLGYGITLRTTSNSRIHQTLRLLLQWRLGFPIMSCHWRSWLLWCRLHLWRLHCDIDWRCRYCHSRWANVHDWNNRFSHPLRK
jgi:hypothetical protein